MLFLDHLQIWDKGWMDRYHIAFLPVAAIDSVYFKTTRTVFHHQEGLSISKINFSAHARQIDDDAWE